MKRTILAFGAAAALGLAGTSHAVVYLSKPGSVAHIEGLSDSVSEKISLKMGAADALANAAGGVGHMLFAPYFTAQDSNNTIFTIVNTDEKSGKAVKVRFRSAANSDDLLDFTVLLSPGDVWTASLTQNEAGLVTVNPTEDTTCTLPAMDPAGWVTEALRLPSDIEDVDKARQTREGYIEVMTMADIPPETSKGSNALYQAIKHGLDAAGNWKPGNCSATAVSKLLDTTTKVNDPVELLDKFGLAASTGGIFGSWWILNQADLASFSGNMTAIRAELEGENGRENGYTNVVFAPQVSSAFNADVAGDAVGAFTADPLLTGDKPVLKALWYDLPDMSTPIIEGWTPSEQVENMGLRHGSLMNEYVAAPDYEVPMTTDWVVSQPTRRYYAAVDYARGVVVENEDIDSNPYTGMTVKSVKGVPMACIGGIGLTTFDREERGTTTLAELSGGASKVSCGEVFTINFTTGEPRSMLRADATSSVVNPKGQAGWGKIVGGVDGGLPLLGFAATAATNQITKIHYDTTYPHRWND